MFRRPLRTLAAALAALACGAGPAYAVGTPPPALENGGSVTSAGGSLRFVLHHAQGQTTITALRTRDGRRLARTTLAGRWGVPVLTEGNQTGGISPDGSTLVIAGVRTSYPSTTSDFAVLRSNLAGSPRLLHFKGDWAFDALSPDATRLYLIQRGTGPSFGYRVRLFDLRSNRLQPGVVAASETPEPMAGLPLSRVTSPDGRWAFTLYMTLDGRAFVHALDASAARAWCIDLPWKGQAFDSLYGLRLRLSGRTLGVRDGWQTVARIDTARLRVASASPRA